MPAVLAQTKNVCKITFVNAITLRFGTHET